MNHGQTISCGSVALDTVKTPFGEASEVLGGSATYFSASASYFTTVDLIAVVRHDFPSQHLAFLKAETSTSPASSAGPVPHSGGGASTVTSSMKRIRSIRNSMCSKPSAPRSPSRTDRRRCCFWATLIPNYNLTCSISFPASLGGLRHDEFLDQRQARRPLARARKSGHPHH